MRSNGSGKLDDYFEFAVNPYEPLQITGDMVPVPADLDELEPPDGKIRLTGAKRDPCFCIPWEYSPQTF